MPSLIFRQLNDNWNAEPNAPEPHVSVQGNTVTLEFAPNAFQFPDFAGAARVALVFTGATRYRLGATNDEGWAMGQCRFGHAAPAWGEFYEVFGDLTSVPEAHDWNELSPTPANARHFLFYLRDETFECAAEDWRFEHTPAVERRRLLSESLHSGHPTPGRLPGRCFPCLVWDHTGTWSSDERQALADHLVEQGCRYAVCAGHNCNDWENAFDEACAAHDCEGDHVMTTSHANESPADVAFFFLRLTNFDAHDFQDYQVLHVEPQGAEGDVDAALMAEWQEWHSTP